MRWLTSLTMTFVERSRVYPRLLLTVVLFISLFNIAQRTGWQGRFGQIIGHDFLIFYSTGTIYRDNPSAMYDFDTQAQTQQQLVSPTPLPGINPNSNPPYVAPIFSLLTSLSLPYALLLWITLNCLCIVAAVALLQNVALRHSLHPDTGLRDLSIAAFSFFPIVEGLQVGQNHGITMLLMSGVAVLSIQNRSMIAGLCCAALLYKPQYCVGFLLLWLVRRDLRALLGFTIGATVWNIPFLARHGLALYREYLHVSSQLVELAYNPGFPGYLLVTPYGLLASCISAPAVAKLAALAISIGVIVWFVKRVVATSSDDRNAQLELYALATFLPLLVTPYALLHDLVIVIPALALLAMRFGTAAVLGVTSVIYAAAFLLVMPAFASGIALPALIPMFLVVAMEKRGQTPLRDIGYSRKGV